MDALNFINFAESFSYFSWLLLKRCDMQWCIAKFVKLCILLIGLVNIKLHLLSIIDNNFGNNCLLKTSYIKVGLSGMTYQPAGDVRSHTYCGRREFLVPCNDITSSMTQKQGRQKEHHPEVPVFVNTLGFASNSIETKEFGIKGSSGTAVWCQHIRIALYVIPLYSDKDHCPCLSDLLLPPTTWASIGSIAAITRSLPAIQRHILSLPIWERFAYYIKVPTHNFKDHYSAL